VKSTDRTILIAVAGLAALAAVWFLLVAPKRDEAASLSSEVTDLHASVEQAEQLAAAAEAAKNDYSSNYHRLVVLGKAAPSSDDTASLFVQLNAIAGKSGTDLEAIKLSPSGASASATAAQETAVASSTPPTDGTSTDSTSTDSTSTDSTSTTDSTTTDSTSTTSTSTTTASTAPAVPATEASAALLPLGAAVGPAGLPVMPYELTLKGNYFQLRDFIDGLQKLVGSKRGRQVVDGRLVTIDDFDFTGDAQKGFPELDATLNVTTYIAPADQGVTAGGTATAPPAPTSTDSTAVPTSSTSTSSTP
jgi:Tfp pilus assembly protein PilO